jgi:hypothetical protein
MWLPFDERGRPRIWIALLFALMTAGFVLAAITATLYSGFANAALLWILSGFFLFTLALMGFVYVKLRQQGTKAR